MNFANVGIPVKILEMNNEALEKGLAVIKKIMMRLPGRPLSEAEVEKRMALLIGTTD